MPLLDELDEGRLGVLYAPLLLDNPERERFAEVSVHEFIAAVRDRYDFRLRGIVADADES
jgi:hypothetical protein